MDFINTAMVYVYNNNNIVCFNNAQSDTGGAIISMVGNMKRQQGVIGDFLLFSNVVHGFEFAY